MNLSTVAHVIQTFLHPHGRNQVRPHGSSDEQQLPRVEIATDYKSLQVFVKEKLKVSLMLDSVLFKEATPDDFCGLNSSELMTEIDGCEYILCRKVITEGHPW